jgi:hypothetical protein
MKRITLYVSIILAISIQTSSVMAENIRPGDYVITTQGTNLYDGTSAILGITRSTYFKVEDAKRGHVRYCKKIDGKIFDGWIRQKDILRIPKEYTAKEGWEAVLDNEISHIVKLTPGKKIGIHYCLSMPIDFMIMDHDNMENYVKNQQGISWRYVSWRTSKMGRNEGTIYWEPPDRENYYAVFNNTCWPEQGIHARRNLYLRYALSTWDKNRGDDDIK